LAADATSLVLVDTSILAYLLIDGDYTPAAQELFERDSDWCSEALVMVEFSNIIAAYVRKGLLTQSQGAKLLTEGQTHLPTLHNMVNAQALETAMQYEISAYDARVIGLAKQLKQKLVTEDRKLRTAVPSWTVSLADALA
jgi:predicted nucleic acid-binding protein